MNDALLRELVPAVIVVLVRRGADFASAEDAVQEALVRALTISQKEGGQTKLLNAGPQVRKLLEMTKLDSVFEIHDDLEKAVLSF